MAQCWSLIFFISFLSENISITHVQTTSKPRRFLTIKLRKRKTEKKVEWSSDTVDNEHLGRRSSKCCCIYEKPRQFGESSSESEGDDDEEGCGSAHCILGHGRRGAGGPTVPPNSGDPYTIILPPPNLTVGTMQVS
uniref:E3 ubiquitin-protein ligase PPP1R11 n=1 Tax=Monopterus albus TaxID=43700 RepID=A0A3Q3JG69_MONAL